MMSRIGTRQGVGWRWFTPACQPMSLKSWRHGVAPKQGPVVDRRPESGRPSTGDFQRSELATVGGGGPAQAYTECRKDWYAGTCGAPARGHRSRRCSLRTRAGAEESQTETPSRPNLDGRPTAGAFASWHYTPAIQAGRLQASRQMSRSAST